MKGRSRWPCPDRPSLAYLVPLRRLHVDVDIGQADLSSATSIPTSPCGVGHIAEQHYSSTPKYPTQSQSFGTIYLFLKGNDIQAPGYLLFLLQLCYLQLCGKSDGETLKRAVAITVVMRESMDRRRRRRPVHSRGSPRGAAIPALPSLVGREPLRERDLGLGCRTAFLHR